MLKLDATEDQIIAAIDQFPQSYHADYHRARTAAKRYFSGVERPATSLANELTRALENWGAGRRKAPKLAPPAKIEATLRSARENLRLLASIPHSSLSITSERRSICHRAIPSPGDLDRVLFQCLAAFASGCFIRNTNVTYPMKAVLLLTGLLPALDSKVRRGLRNAGLPGFTRTSIPLPTCPFQRDYMRIGMLPFIVGALWRLHGSKLARCTQLAGRPELSCEPGRLVDILLFTQGGGLRLLTLDQQED